MIVYECRITGHEMISDSYAHEDCGVDGLFRVRSAFVSEGGETIAGVDDGEDGGADAEMVNNVESAARLQEFTFDNKSQFKEWFKGLAQATRKALKEDASVEQSQVKQFMQNCQGILKWVNENWADLQFYTNPDFEIEGTMAFAIHQEHKDFFFMSDTLKAVKF